MRYKKHSTTDYLHSKTTGKIEKGPFQVKRGRIRKKGVGRKGKGRPVLRFGVGWVKAYFVGNRKRGRLAEEWRLVYGASLRCAARALSLRVQYCRRQHFKVGADPDPPEASGI